MAISTDNLRFILGLKLRRLRQDQDESLKELSERSGLSVSYLSEIEKGKKYPKPDKILDLANALGVAYDDLVSLRVTDELTPLKEIFSSTFIQEFPFHLFGLEPQDVFSLIADQPSEAGALIRTFLEIGRTYDMQVEHFLFAALRSYQQMHSNYFEELEAMATDYRAHRGWDAAAPPSAGTLRAILEDEYGYSIDTATLPNHPHLNGFRSVFVEGASPLLYINGDLKPSQKAFTYGREIGYQELDVDERVTTSSWLKVESFDQVLNNFKASYFSGALLMAQDTLLDDLAAFFDQDTWNPDVLQRCMDKYRVTPEMLYYRMTELVPQKFGLDEIYFMRFHNEAGTNDFDLTKVLNMSRVPVPHGIGPEEHYCRRWPAMHLLNDLARQQQASATNGTAPNPPIVRAQRSRFINNGAEFFVISSARPLSLTPGTNSCVSLGFLMNEAFKERIRFWNDDSIPRIDVNLTCERCPLAPEECQVRTAPPTVYEEQQRQAVKEDALAELMTAARSTSPTDS